MKPYYTAEGAAIYCGDARELLAMKPDDSVDCVVTSPPYWGLRDYGLPALAWGGRNDCVHEWSEWHAAAQSCLRCTAWCGSLGLEPTPELYVEHLVEIFREVRRVLKPEGTCWLNIGDSYAAATSRSTKNRSSFRRDRMERQDMDRIAPGLKPKDLCLIPFRLALALQSDGWYVRSDIIWNKPNPMPESVRDRPTKSHEYVFLLAKSERYYFNQDAVRESSIGKTHHDLTGQGYRAPGQTPQAGNRKSEPLQGSHGTTGHDGNGMRMPEKWNNPLGRNIRTVWTIPTQPFPEAHFAVYPEKLVEPCIKAGCPEGGLVLDPFTGAGTTAVVARRLGCRFIGAELNEEYCEIALNRLGQSVLEFEGADQGAG